MQTIKFDIVTPEKQVFSRDVEMVVVPGEDGDFGVLAGHVPMISSIRSGAINIYSGANITDRLFVTGGVAEVTGERCTILATEAVDLSSLTRSDVEARLEKANEDLLDARNEEEKSRAEKSKKLAEELVKLFN